MSSIAELVSKYARFGYPLATSRNMAAEEIILRKISASDMVDQVVLKGGIVMFNLTHNSRRATRDIDFDFIRYSIDESSIRTFIRKLNQVKDGLDVEIQGPIKQLNQEDYQGVRIHVLISDANNDVLSLKMDIGVHVYLDIDQQNVSFSFLDGGESVFLQVNPPEQIFAEKMISLARLGPVSTRYKDIYDMLYLSKVLGLDSKKLKSIFTSFFNRSSRGPHDFKALRDRISSTLDSQMFEKEAKDVTNRWLNVGYEEAKEMILSTLYGLLSD